MVSVSRTTSSSVRNSILREESATQSTSESNSKKQNSGSSTLSVSSSQSILLPGVRSTQRFIVEESSDPKIIVQDQGKELGFIQVENLSVGSELIINFPRVEEFVEYLDESHEFVSVIMDIVVLRNDQAIDMDIGFVVLLDSNQIDDGVLKFVYFDEQSLLWRSDGLEILSVTTEGENLYSVIGHTDHLTNFAILLGSTNASSSLNEPTTIETISWVVAVFAGVIMLISIALIEARARYRRVKVKRALLNMEHRIGSL